MILKASYKYQLSDCIKPVIVFYCILLAFILLMTGSVVITETSGTSIIGGIETVTAIFLFVAGLNSFKESFLMLIQNSVSRKTIFFSRTLAMITIAFIMAVTDKIFLLIGKAVSTLDSGFVYNSLYELMYESATHGNSFFMHVNILIYDLLLYKTVFSIGYLITVLFYRLNKAGKIAVGAGVPVGLFILLPIANTLFFKSGISRALYRFIIFALGINTVNPYAAMITFAVSSVILCALSWLLMRRAVVKV